MSSFMILLIYPMSSLFLSLMATRALIYLLPRLGCVAHPRAGHIHQRPIPTGGGIGLLLVVTIIGGTLLVSQGQQVAMTTMQRLPAIFIPFLVITLIGVVDDRFDLHYRIKFSMQISAAFLAWMLGLRLETLLGFELPLLISCFLTIFWIFLFMNAYNLIDGIDGLASEMSLIASVFTGALFFSIQLPVEATLALVVGSATLGFYRYNRHPAKVFLGDTGSTGIGYLLGALGLLYHAEVGSYTSVIAPILLSAIPWFDGFMALWRRLTRKLLQHQGTSQPGSQKMLGRDMDHLHHRFLQKMGKQSAVSRIFFRNALAVACIVFAFEVTSGWIKLFWLSVMALIILYAVFRVADLEVDNTRRILVNRFSNKTS